MLMMFNDVLQIVNVFIDFNESHSMYIVCFILCYVCLVIFIDFNLCAMYVYLFLRMCTVLIDVY